MTRKEKLLQMIQAAMNSSATEKIDSILVSMAGYVQGFPDETLDERLNRIEGTLENLKERQY